MDNAPILEESKAFALADTRPWYKNPRLRTLNAWIVLLLITASTSGYDGSMMNGLLSLDIFEKDFNHPTGGTLGLFNAIQHIGNIGALPFAPYMTDWLGRRKSIFLGASIMVIAAILQASAQSLGMFIGARFMIGFGSTFAGNAAPLLTSEIAYPTQRAPLTSIYNSLWYSGAIIAAWTTFGTFYIKSSWAWRIPSAMQAIPSVLQVLLIWFVPESPRWLVGKGREAEARNVLGYWHGNGDDHHPLVEFELNEIKASLELEREVSKKVGYRSLFSTPGNRRRMRIIIALAFFSQWSGNGLVSYYLHAVFDAIGITNVTIQLLINGILQIWNLAWALGGGLVCERVGRRKLFLTSCIGMLLFFVSQTICFARADITGSKSAANAVIAFIFLYYAAYDIALSPLIITYAVEILPFGVRAKGFNVFSFTLFLALVFNQYVNPIALGAIGWKYYIVYDCFLLFEIAFCYIYVVETKNLTLEETAAIFDGVGDVDKVVRGATAVATGENIYPVDTSSEKDGSEKVDKI